MKNENWIAKGTAGHDTHGQSAVYCGNTGKNVAIVYDGKAHADLIAAAPELLMVLENIIQNAGYESGEAEITLRELCVHRKFLDQARAAIAATKGGN